jgi:hypothetical protein
MMAVAGMNFTFEIIRLIVFLSSVPQEKFVEYVTTSDDYKNHLNRPLQ